MPPQPSSTSTETVRLADVFVRLPNDHHHHQQHSAKRTPPQTGSSENPPPASAQHRYPSAPKEPPTPQKKTSNVSEIATQGPHLPPTPAATPTKKNLKRGPATDPHTPSSSSSSSSSIKRLRTAHHLTTPTPSPSPHRRFVRAPKFSIVYQPEPRLPRREEGGSEGGISWLELKRAAESVMRQVCWEEVAEDVASNRSPGTYKRAVRGFLQARIEELVSGEEKEEEEGAGK